MRSLSVKDVLVGNQKQWCRRLGVSQAAISRYISGERRPRSQRVRRILLRLGVDPKFL